MTTWNGFICLRTGILEGGGWRRLHNFYASTNIEICGSCSTHGKDEKCIQNFGRKPERKRPFGIPRRRWEDNRMDVRNVRGGRCGVDASGSGWNPVTGCCEHGNEPSVSIKGGEFLDQLSEYFLLKKDSAPWSWVVILLFLNSEHSWELILWVRTPILSLLALGTSQNEGKGKVVPVL
jgi:hypothetical protein